MAGGGWRLRGRIEGDGRRKEGEERRKDCEHVVGTSGSQQVTQNRRSRQCAAQGESACHLNALVL